MATEPTSRENGEIIDSRTENNQIDIEKIKSMLTEEQVISDNVARRRRRFTKKRSTSLTKRDPTPIRRDDEKTTSEEEVFNPKPKTPERPRRPKRTKSAQIRNVSETDTPSIESNNVSRTNSFKTKLKSFEERVKPSDEPKKRFARRSEERKKSLSDLAQEEVVAIFNKTKKTITNAAIKGRERFRKDKEHVKRSQSAPNKIEEQELIKSFKDAQFLAQQEKKPRKYSESSLPVIIPDSSFAGPIIKKAKALRPGSISGIRQRKHKPEYSTKIVEILDPSTQNVVSRKTLVRLPQVGVRELFKILRFYSIREIYREFKKFRVEMKVECKRIKVLWNKCMFKLFLILMLCGAAGFAFKFVEGGFENFYKCGVKRVKRDFIDLLWTKSHNLREEDWKSLFRNKLRVFEEELHVAHEAGMKTYSGQRSWSFLNGVVYALTIVTTIGYGHIFPETQTGRALTIIYAIIGIPLFLIALTDFGKLFTRAIKFLWSFVRRLYYTGSCRKARKSAKESDIFRGAQMMYEIATFRRASNMSVGVDDSHMPKTAPSQTSAATQLYSEETPTTPDLSTFEIDDEFNLPISVALFILVAYMFIGALIYCAWEKWAFFESFYFVFISLSTVGFGDFIPRHPICVIVSIVYLVFGLALMSMCINVVQVKLSDTFQQASLKLSSSMGFELSEEESSHSLDILTLEKDESVQNILEQEEEEEAKMGIRRGKSMKLPLRRFANEGDENPIDVPVSVPIDNTNKLGNLPTQISIQEVNEIKTGEGDVIKDQPKNNSQ